MDSDRSSGYGGTKTQAGFTLLELLIAVAILGLLAVMMFSGLRFGTDAWSKSEARAADTDEIVAVQDLLRREISTAYPEFVRAQQGASYVNFDGAPNSLGFRGQLPRQIGFSEIGWIEFSAGVRGRENQLIMSWRLVRPKGGQGFPAESPTDLPILSNITGVQFAYFGPDQPNQPGYWHGSWQQRTTLPQLVKVGITFSSGVKRYWPELIIAAKIDVDSRCLYDSVSRNCRGRT